MGRGGSSVLGRPRAGLNSGGVTRRIFVKEISMKPALIVLGLYFSLTASALEVGDTATCVDVEVMVPEVGVETLCPLAADEGKKYTLVELSSTTCGACVANFPIFAAFVGEHAGVLGSRTILIDRNKDESLRYVSRHPEWFNEPVALDVSRKLMRMFGGRYTPTQYLLDSDLKIVWTHIGVMGRREKSEILEIITDGATVRF